MSLRMTVLGSGSSGNATLLALGEGEAARYILLDAGLSPRATRHRLVRVGVALQQIEAIVLTHLDGDHFRHGWLRVCRRFGITIHCSRRHFRSARARGGPGCQFTPFDDGFTLADARFEPIPLAHDALGTVGFVIEWEGRRLGFATDLGRVPRALLQRSVDLDALALESNYDRRMQLASGRPGFLKSRIMGGAGHLSNEQSLEAALEIADQSRLQHVVLLHVSRECNRPQIIRALYQDRAPHLHAILQISRQDEPTPWLTIKHPADAVALNTDQHSPEQLFS